MKKDKISIIIPAYNAEKTIKRCLDSIINSTYKNIEIIVVNDESRDNTLKILREYEKKHSYITVIDKKNGGQAEARNDGIKLSTGKYMMFIDSDDFIEKNYLEVMHNEIVKTKNDVCISGYKKYNADYECTAEVKYDYSLWKLFTICIPWAKIFRSDFIKKNKIFFPNIRYCEDSVFSVLTISKTNKISIIDNSGYGNYYNSKSLTNHTFRSFKVNVIPANEQLLNDIDKKYYEENKSLISFFIIKQSIYYLLNSGRMESSKKFVEKNKEVMNWLKENIDIFKKKSITSIFYPKDEKISIRLILFIYTLLNKLHLITIFSKVYCKNKIN